MPFVLRLLGQEELGGGPFAEESSNETFQVVLMVVVGISVFLVCFLLLMNNVVRYIREINRGIRQIADGDLSAQIEVKGNDELTYIATSLNDMTGKLERLMDRERESERTKNELITSVAHDLRTPLTSILGYMEFLSMGQKLDEVTRDKYIHVVYLKAKRLQKLIEDLFSFTKLNYGKIAMKVDKVDIVMLLNQLLEDFYPSFADKNLEYEFCCEESSLLIDADGNLIARLFDNLINNAIKYGAEGKLIKVELVKEYEQVVVRVINYGYVIPKDDLNKIFNKFYRVEQSRSENTGGTGLGLAIVKNVVDMHRGKITVKSGLDGTVFEVRLNISFNPDEEKLELNP
ncbi:MAG: HAMP domain-containing histidine kinase [Lachnospiraceae bacterium]|nr:HAMP domain-containing histidine kinase [Lachnospiraceae bacterium]